MTYLASTHPELAAQLADPALGEQLTAGSNKKVLWVCPVHPETHRWDAVLASRVAGSGCPYCSGRRVLVGFNDIATTHPELAAELTDPADRTALSAGSNRLVSWTCSLGHSWTTKPTARAHAGTGCPVCSGRRVLAGFNDIATTHPELAAELVDPADGTRLMAGSGKKVWWQCTNNAAHRWSASPNGRTSMPGRIRGCPVCAGKKVIAGVNDLATERPDLAAQLADPQPDGMSASELALTLRPASNKVVLWHCDKHPGGYTWSAAVNNRRAGTSCPVCAERVVADGLNDLATTHPSLLEQAVDPQPDGTSREELGRTVSRDSHRQVLWICPKGHS